MGVVGDAQRPGDGCVPAGGDLDVAAARQGQDRQRVAHDMGQLHVAGHAAHAGDLGFWRGAGVEQRQGVIDAGVAVDEQRDCGPRSRRFQTLGLHRRAIRVIGLPRCWDAAASSIASLTARP